ncbi:hypothetical protein ACROYT_G028306 [Oculina patagonica]
MSSKKHKSRKRTRSRSPSSRQNSVASHDAQSESSSPKRRRDLEEDTLQRILHSIESLSGRIDSLETRSNQLESATSTDLDALSLMADDTPSLMELDVPLTSNKSLETSSSSIRAPIEPIEAPIESLKAPIEPIKAPIEPDKAPKDSSKTADEAVSLDHGLFDPVAQPTSWKPSSSFSNFLESNFRRKLTYQQALVILEGWAIPEVDCLSAPKLDQQLLNQVPSKLKRYAQERDKEMFTLQRALLNTTGPLCGLHDCIENGSTPSYEEIKLALEQALCLLGSANTQLSILRRQRVLASINKSRINLAELPLPNAKRDVSKTPRVPSHLENPNIGPTDPFNCVRVQDNFFQNSFPKVSSIYPIIGSGGTPNFTGDQRVVAERGHREDPLFKRRLLQPPFSCTQKGWTYASGDRSKLSEQVHFKRAFPDGKSQLFENVAFKRRFYDKYRFKGRLPFSSRPPVISKVSSVYLGGHLLPVQSPPIRPVFSPQNLYKTNEANRSIPEEKVNTSPYLPGRLPSLSCYKGGSCEKHSSVSDSPSVPRIYSKLQKVIPDSFSGYHLSGFQNRLNVYDAVTPSRKDQQDPRLCSPSTSSSKDHTTKPSKLNRFTRVLPASHLASTAPFPPPAMRPHMGPANEPGVLRRPNYSVNQCQRRTDLVVGKHPQYKRQPCTPASPRYANHDRRLHERLGCGASLPRDQWQIVTTGVPPTHQLPGAKSSLPGHKNLSQRQVSRNRISANRQHDRHCLYQQQRGYTFPPTPNSSPGVMGLVPGKRHLCDSFSHPRKRQRLCRQGVQRIQGHERVEVRPNNHPTLPGPLSDRPIRESTNKPTEELHQLETRPRGHPHRRLHDNLDSSARLCLSSIQLDIQNSGEGNDRANRDNSSRSNLANAALVAGSVEASNISASSTAEHSNPPNRPIRSEQSSPNVSSPSLGRVSHLYQRFQAEGIPTNVADLLIAATRTSTHKTYESSWNRWCRWCSGRQIDPLSSSINDILIFLTEVFNEGLAYRSINVLRSAISSTHPKIDGYPVGQHPYVTRLLKGALNKRPPKPRYSHTWNVDIMVKYIISLGKNSSLTLKVLSMKLVTLLALTCPERISTLANLDLRHCYVHPEGVSFQLTIPRKTGSVDKPAEAFFARFNQDKKLCPVECFRHYLKLTRNIRPVVPSSLPDKLFISFKRPFKPVTTTTLGRWLRAFMSAAGIDSKIFKAHSVRGASTTAAANAFVPLSTIMSMADWSSSSTFRTFYYKPLYNSDFATGVLTSK